MSSLTEQELSRQFLSEAWDTKIPALKAVDQLTCTLCAARVLVWNGAWLTDLHPALQAKCPLCTIVFHAIVRTQQCDPHLSRVQFFVDTDLHFSLVSVRDWDFQMDTVTKRLDVEFFTLKGETKCDLHVVLARDDLHEERSERWLPVMKAWLENCEKNHPACVAKQAVLPTRVIDVGTWDDDYVKLCISEGDCANYLALSHCWWYVNIDRILV
jgi:hypothetical protein